MAHRRDQPYNALPLLPPKQDLETKAILKQTIASARALADLRGIAAKVPNPRILINGIVLQEARLSSEIENIVTTSDELYRAAANGDGVTDAHTKEVLRYREALWYGFEQLAKRPLSANLAIEIVGIIRQVQMDVRKVPGTSLKNSRGEVIYTPPEGEGLIRDKLGNLETFIHHDDDEIDPLVKLAVMHYQFEAIHPFSDGNGRTGRILNVLYLVEKKLLDMPVLYLSHYILRNKADYYHGLRSVTEDSRWEEWVLFMLKAVEQTAKETCGLVNQILKLMTETTERVKAEQPGIYTKDLIEVIYSNPYCRIRFLEDAGLAKRQTASGYLQKLASMGILEPVKVGREMYYINHGLLQVLSERK
ncbi:Fic family protein [Silvibacterium sp.]|uniref:Fic family protein n=1 Tax=Silvibacterium sp. TaxID=1964179 RepID=UPI0039E4F1D8